MNPLAKCITLVAPICFLAWSPLSAHAGTYAVDACQRPDGAPVGHDGWLPANRGPHTYFGDNCAAGAGLDASLDPNVEHDFGSGAEWSFKAPSGTTLARIAAFRTAGAARDRPNGSPTTYIRADGRALELCATPYGCQTASGEINYDLSNASEVVVGVECGGAPGGRCPAGASSIAIKRIRVTVTDEQPPAFSRGSTGSLTSLTDRSRVRTLNYSAVDAGSGVYRHRLLVDGVQVAAGSSSPQNPNCSLNASGGFEARRPCTGSVSNEASVDTLDLAEGSHTVKLEVVDATSTNTASDGPWSITVDNRPPTLGTVRLTGKAAEGELLQCAADVDGQSPNVGFAWTRGNSDGSGEAAIAGAQAATYTLTAADVGKKVRCAVTATDVGGSTSGKSTITDGPFADGAVVAAKPVVAASQGATGSSGASGKDGLDGSAGGSGAGGAGGAGGASGTAGAAGGGGSGGTVAGAVAAAAAAATAAVPQCVTSTAKGFGTVTKFVRSYNRSSLKLSGRLVGPAGEARGGRTLEVVQTVVRAGSAQRTTIATVRTGADGSYRVTAPPGPSRALQLVDPGCGSLGPVLTEKVRGAVQARTTTRRVKNRQTARITGRVLGGYVGRGIPLELQVKVGRQWRDVKHTMSNSRGEYRVGYRFLRTYVRYTYQFRVVTRAGGAWPYMPGKSRVVKVRVN